MASLKLHGFNNRELIGNDDGDGNENGKKKTHTKKKTIGLD